MIFSVNDKKKASFAPVTPPPQRMYENVPNRTKIPRLLHPILLANLKGAVLVLYVLLSQSVQLMRDIYRPGLRIPPISISLKYHFSYVCRSLVPDLQLAVWARSSSDK